MTKVETRAANLGGISVLSSSPALALQLYPRGSHRFWRATFGCKLIQNPLFVYSTYLF